MSDERLKIYNIQHDDTYFHNISSSVQSLTNTNFIDFRDNNIQKVKSAVFNLLLNLQLNINED